MSKKRASTTPKDDSAQSITNYYRLRSIDQTVGEQSQVETNSVPLSQTKESLDITMLPQTGVETEQVTVPEHLPEGTNALFISMMNQINSGLKEGMKEMGQNLETKLTNSIKSSTEEIRNSVGKLQVDFQTFETNLSTTIAKLNQKVQIVEEKSVAIDNRMEEAERRICETEERVEHLLNLPPEVEILHGQMGRVMNILQMDECTKRRNNIIINGVPGTKATIEEAEKTFRDLCENQMKLGPEWAKSVVLDEVYRFPSKQKDSKEWPIFVVFHSTVKKDEFYKNTPNLKGTGISVRNDLAPHLLREKTELIKKQNKLREAPYNYQARVRDLYNKVWLVYRKAETDRWKIWNPNERILGTDD